MESIEQGAGGQVVFGFIPADREVTFGRIASEGRDVSTLVFRDVAAVCAETAPAAADRESLLRNLASHQAVIETVMDRYPIVPAKFGTTLKSREDVFRALASGYAEIRRWIAEMRDRIELDVVALWPDLGPVLAEMGRDPRVSRLREAIQAQGAGPGRIELGKKVRDCLEEKRSRLRSEILLSLGPRSLDHRLHPLMDDSMIVNAAFLLEKREARDLDQAIEALDRRFGGQVLFRVVGPLPGYSFCTLEIKSTDGESVEQARETLGVHGEINPATLREAFRGQTRAHHPDRNPGDPGAEGRFESIRKAYALLLEVCGQGRGQEEGCPGRPGTGARIVVRPMEASLGVRDARA